MSDVFMSYSREDRDRAEQLATRLKSFGYTVWWDRKILAGNTFDEAIQKALDQARCVLVLWSQTSVKSDWVKEEAGIGEARGILVPALIDDVPIPLGFGRIQTARLVGWNGDPAASDLRDLARSIEATITGARSQVGMEWEKSRGVPTRPRLRRPTAVDSGELTDAVMRALGPDEPLPEPLPEPVIEPVIEPAIERAAAPMVAAGAAKQRHGSAWLAFALVAAVAASATYLYATGALESSSSLPQEVVPTATEPPPPDPAALARQAGLRLDELRLLARNPRTSDGEVLAAYETLWAEARQHLREAQRVEMTEMIGGLHESLAELERLQAMDAQGKLPTAKRLERWRAFRPARRAGPTGALLSTRLDELEAELETQLGTQLGTQLETPVREASKPQPAEPARETPRATRGERPPAKLAAEDRFVTCKDVSKQGERGLYPEEMTEEFPPGSVVAFAWLRVLRGKERVTFEWVGVDGAVVARQTAEVGQGTAFRVYRSATYDHPGKGEVRLYNEEKELIGRKRFKIVG